jgi:maltose alpha-D-glucosyltransferase/alpha-amylase
MLKILRRLNEGIHPETEMTRYLTEKAFAHTAPLLGEVVRFAQSGEPTTFAIIQGFVRNQGDAWEWMQQQIARATDEIGTGDAEHAEDWLTASTTFAGVIGTRIGEMHAVLAQPTDQEAFAPGRADRGRAEAWGRDVADMLAEALHCLATKSDWERNGDAELVSALVQRQGALEEAIKALARRGAGALTCRIHGDFHLGQVLVANGDAYIIDFEGEPKRPLAERRAKTSPLRDVAGLLRSLDYLAALMARKGEVGIAATTEPQRGDLLQRFGQAASSAFLGNYRTATIGIDGGDQDALLELFLIEKAAYEICYEAANRPAWIDVPMRGLSTLADRILGGSAQATGAQHG